jgi:hypothetical protein
MFAPEWLADWPDRDHRSRLVFVVHNTVPGELQREVFERFAFASPQIIGPREFETPVAAHPGAV